MHAVCKKNEPGHRAYLHWDPAREVTAMAAYPLLLEAALVFFSARFSFRDLDAAVLALFFFGDLSAIGHPSLGSTDGFGA
jgi:hypothetical protein